MAMFISTQPDFRSVLAQSDDQAIVRYLLIMHVPKDIKDKIVDEYNSHVLGINDVRLQNERVEQSLKRTDATHQSEDDGVDSAPFA